MPNESWQSLYFIFINYNMYKCLSGDAEPSLTRILNFTIYTRRVITWIIAQPSNFDKSIKHLINSIKFGITAWAQHHNWWENLTIGPLKISSKIHQSIYILFNCLKIHSCCKEFIRTLTIRKRYWWTGCKPLRAIYQPSLQTFWITKSVY